MRTNDQLTLFKFLAVGAALLYLYKVTKAQGGSLQGRYNPESIANLGAQLLPKEYQHHARKFGTALLNKYVQ